MTSPRESAGGMTDEMKVMEDVIRVGLIVLLAVWCFHVMRPFLVTLLWGVVIAVMGGLLGLSQLRAYDKETEQLAEDFSAKAEARMNKNRAKGEEEPLARKRDP